MNEKLKQSTNPSNPTTDKPSPNINNSIPQTSQENARIDDTNDDDIKVFLFMNR